MSCTLQNISLPRMYCSRLTRRGGCSTVCTLRVRSVVCGSGCVHVIKRHWYFVSLKFYYILLFYSGSAACYRGLKFCTTPQNTGYFFMLLLKSPYFLVNTFTTQCVSRKLAHSFASLHAALCTTKDVTSFLVKFSETVLQRKSVVLFFILYI